MKRYRDKLELTYKSVRIRNIQRSINLVQIFLIVVLSIVILALSGISLSPFYFPLDFLFFFFIVMLLVFSLEAIVFRMMEIGYSKSDSAKYLMAKNSLKRAIVLLVISIIILATPLLASYAKGELSQTGTYTVAPTDPLEVPFTSRDRLALTQTKEVRVNAQGGDVQAYMCTKEDYDNQQFSDCPSDLGVTIVFPETFLRKGYGRYVLYVTSSTPSSAPRPISYSIDIEPSPFIVSFIPVMAAISIIAQGIWMGFLIPIMRRYASVSIYSKKYAYATGVPQDEYVVPYNRRVEFEVATPYSRTPDEYRPSDTVVKREIAPESVDIDAVLAEARHYFNVANYEMALKGFDRVLSAEQDNLMALTGKAQIFEAQKKPAEALECYDHVLALNSNVESNWVKTGDLLVNLGRKNEAAERYRTALSLNPSSPAVQRLNALEDDPQFLMSQAQYLSGIGRFDEALNYYDRVLHRDNENIRALIGKSIVLRGIGRLDETEAALKAALNIDYYNSTALDGLVRCYDEKLRLNPQDENVWIARGDILIELGKINEGLQSFNNALAINPNSEEAKVRIADLTEAPPTEMDIYESLIQEYIKFPGVGRARAKALINAGYATMDDLARAKAEDLMRVKGISDRLANIIVASLRTE